MTNNRLEKIKLNCHECTHYGHHDYNYLKINYWYPFETFNNSPVPNDISEYYVYQKNVMSFINSRNKRILQYSNLMKM